MLIILSGLETIHKKFFSREIISALNIFHVDDYTVNFANHGTKIYNVANELVYSTPDDLYPEGITKLLVNAEDGSSNEAGKAIFARVQALDNSVFNDGVRDNHFANIFSEPLYDFGLIPTQERLGDNPPDMQYLQPHTYKDVLHNYNARSFENFVITGVFSRAFVEKIRNDLGAANVIVLNIIRNPSVCFVLNEKDPTYYELKKPTLSRTPLMDARKLTTSILNAAILKETPGVDTLVFEEILTAGSFVVEGVKVLVPPDYQPFNKELTIWENANIIPNDKVSLSDVATFNATFTNYYAGELPSGFSDYPTIPNFKDQAELDKFNAEFGSSLTLAETNALVVPRQEGVIMRWQDMLPIFNAAYNANATLEQFTALFPMNLFEKLGYVPLTYEEIVAAS